MRPLEREITSVSEAGVALNRSREAARQVWRDEVFRTLESRSFQRLETESRLYASALVEVDALLAQALALIS